MESQVFEDEVRPATERTDQPAEEMSERHDHGKNFSGEDRIKLAPSPSFRRCTTFWRGTNTLSDSVRKPELTFGLLKLGRSLVRWL